MVISDYCITVVYLVITLILKIGSTAAYFPVAYLYTEIRSRRLISADQIDIYPYYNVLYGISENAVRCLRIRP